MVDRHRLLGELGRHLREARARSGMTVSDLARAAGVSRRYVTDAEAGRANLSVVKLVELARVLRVPVASLCDFSTTRAGRRVALVGLRGAGKSTLGPRLASALDAQFVELDRRVEERAGMGLGEIFSVHGEAGFHRFEGEALEELLAQGENVVVAAGGSIVADEGNFRRLLESFRTVWLRAEPSDHFQRVLEQGDHRPMQDRPRAMAELQAILKRREELYARCDDVVTTSGRSVEETLAELVAIVAPSP